MDETLAAQAHQKINDHLATAALMRQAKQTGVRHPFPRHAIAEQIRRFADRLDS